MMAETRGDLTKFFRDVLVGLAIFCSLAVFLLGGEPPRDLPPVAHVLSIEANAADYYPITPLQAHVLDGPHSDAKPFRFTDGWTALSAMAIMFAMLYAFNLALFRRFAQRQARVNRRRL